MNAHTLNAYLFGPGDKAQDPLAIAVRGIAVSYWNDVTDLAVQAKGRGEDYRGILTNDLSFPSDVAYDFDLVQLTSAHDSVVWALLPR